MCGILAIWNRNGATVDLDGLARGTTALRHRGPDDEGYVLIDSRSGRAVACGGRDTRPDVSLPALERVGAAGFDLALAHRRLAILDRSRAGHQPMSSDDGAVWITYNGMIYNHADVRARLAALGHRFRTRTDTEVVLRAYDEWGAGCVEHFNGMWAFVLWDGRERRLFASRDRLGIKPLVHHVTETVAAFSSELKGLTAFPRIPTRLDGEALHHYLSLMKVPAPFTIYDQIRKLLPGHSIAVGERSVADTAHWTLEPGPPVDGHVPIGAIEELDDLIRDSVRLRLGGDVPVGTLLSGGVDSSVVTAFAAALSAPAAIPTYTLSIVDSEGDESAWAARVSAHLSTDHHPVRVSADALDALPRLVELFDEPFAVSSAIGVHALAREASKQVKVLLTGDGGDELFAGYLNRYERVDALWDRIARSRDGRLGGARAEAVGERVRWKPFGSLARAEMAADAAGLSDHDGRDVCFSLRKVILNEAEKRELYTPDWQDRTRAASTISWLRSRLPALGPERLARWQALDIRTSLHDEMLAKVDKATMACGIEARVPLLDHRVVELATRLPARLKIAEGEGKWILKKVGERYVPRQALYRPKRGFEVPISDWFRDGWRAFVRDTLDPSALRRSGVLRHDAVASVIAHHESNPGFTASHMVFTLLCFQIWHDVCHRPARG